MKKSDIEKQLKKDLSDLSPSDFDRVWSKCTTPASEEREFVTELVTVSAHDGSATATSSRKAVPIATVAIVVLVILAAVICWSLLGNSDENLFLPSQSGYFIIDINPSMQVNYDANGVVTLAKGLNGDGEELLEGLELDGLTYDKALDEIFDRCVSRGYLSAERDDNAILMTASNDKGEKDEKMTAEINKKFTQKFEAKKISGVVISDVDNTKGQKDADKYGISGQKYELIQYYISLGGTLDESEYETITIREIYARISELDKNKKDK